MPGESDEGAREAVEGAESRAKFLAVLRENIRRRGGPASIVIASGRGAGAHVGLSLEDLAKKQGKSPEQVAADIIIAGGASIVSHNMSEDDVATIMRQPWTMASSDGGLTLPGAGRPHPRNNGAFARRLAHYVRDKRVISLDDAVRSATTLPARVFGLAERGQLREGAFADIIVFDLARIVDRATYNTPHEMATGMDWVLVNGRVAVQDGGFTGVRAGRVLKR